MGSVKDLEVLEEPSGAQMGSGRFHFSDRYSVFDWGEMPDLIENKGKALCMIGAHFFETLQSMGINNHYLGVVDVDGQAKPLREVEAPSQIMEVKLVRVIEPDVSGGSYDYSVYRGEEGNMLIPLEVIYRNSLPPGSSVFGRLQRGEMRIEDLGLDSLPEPGATLDEQEAARRAADVVRDSGQPVFLELRTYRFRAHSMYDPDLYRTKEEIARWKERDPIDLLVGRLRERGVLDGDDVQRLDKEAQAEVAAAIEFAEAGTLEPLSDLERFVHSEVRP
jgi:hypothetical protein